MKTAFVISTCCLWHKDIYEQLGVGSSIKGVIRVVKQYLKSKKLKLNLDQYNMLSQYQQTQGLMRANDYPNIREFEIIIQEVPLNQYSK